MATNTVMTHWKKNLLFSSDNPLGQTVLMDTTEEGGGNGIGLSPKALMLSSLAGCSGLDVIMILKKMQVIPENFEIKIEAELTEEHPKYYNKVKVEYHFFGKELNKDKINKAVKLSVTKYCGVMQMFRQFAEINTEIYIH